MPVLFEVPRSWRPSLENGGLFHTVETWPQVEVMKCGVIGHEQISACTSNGRVESCGQRSGNPDGKWG